MTRMSLWKDWYGGLFCFKPLKRYLKNTKPHKLTKLNTSGNRVFYSAQTVAAEHNHVAFKFKWKKQKQKQGWGVFQRCGFGTVAAQMASSSSSFIDSLAIIECCLDCKQARSCLCFWIANQTSPCFHLCSPAAIILTTYKIQIWGRKKPLSQRHKIILWTLKFTFFAGSLDE